ncbi:MAG TPA: hypothetical protein VN836_07805 [Verrucomicrobiae bacterium]|nr:hypothetical protein [Verrucomicrobiae bacterium]
MSAVCILTPVVIAAWPAFSAAVVAAATSLGYTIVKAGVEEMQTSQTARTGEREVTLEIEQSEIVTNQLGRDQCIKVTRGTVTVTFSRDARGKASVCVTGPGHSDEELRAIGEELSQRVVQKYVYSRLIEECRARQFNIVEEAVDENNAIRLKVRHWDG